MFKQVREILHFLPQHYSLFIFYSLRNKNKIIKKNIYKKKITKMR